jgi:hypothetical protein
MSGQDLLDKGLLQPVQFPVPRRVTIEFFGPNSMNFGFQEPFDQLMLARLDVV